MKKLFLILIFIISFSSFSQTNYNTEKYYGKEFSVLDIKDYKSNKQKFIADTENLIKIEGEILSSCPKKGCWMRVETGNDTLFVKFKDYGFFVPKSGVDGKEVVFKGTAFYDTVSVADQKHYAQDAGKSIEEIEKIVDDQYNLSFVADGVIIE